MSVSWMWAVLITAQWGLVRSGFPGGPVGKESACNAGDPGSIPGSGRSPGEGNGNPLTNVAGESQGHRSLWATIQRAARVGH